MYVDRRGIWGMILVPRQNRAPPLQPMRLLLPNFIYRFYISLLSCTLLPIVIKRNPSTHLISESCLNDLRQKRINFSPVMKRGIKIENNAFF